VRIGVVLVRPRNPLNIGAAARAMANFGFARLGVVAPYAPHWREARSAVGAPELLGSAVETATLAEAVADCTLVAGTGTLTYRKPEQPVVPLPDLTPLVRRELERGGRVALVFGPEKHGLTREDLSYCHFLVEIPTDRRQPSMNLGQAVSVCLYELAGRGQTRPSNAASVEVCGIPLIRQKDGESKGYPAGWGGPEHGPGEEKADDSDPAAHSRDLDRLTALVAETMIAAGYSPSSMQAANRHDLRLLLRRLAPTGRDTRRILGLFRRILWRLKRVPKRD